MILGILNCSLYQLDDIKKTVDDIVIKHNINHIISDKFKDKDSCIIKYATKDRISLKIFKPNFGIYGEAGQLILFNSIVDKSDVLLIGGSGYSVDNAVYKAKTLGKIIYYLEKTSDI